MSEKGTSSSSEIVPPRFNYVVKPDVKKVSEEQRSESCPNEWKQMGETVSRATAKHWSGTEVRGMPGNEKSAR